MWIEKLSVALISKIEINCSRIISAQCLLHLICLLTICKGEDSPKKRICVIGAGRAGLAAIKIVADKPDIFDVVAFERNSDVGGLWIYRDDMFVDEHGFPAYSGIYKNLRTNIPKHHMVYPDYTSIRSEGNRYYISHEVFLEYMRNHTDHFQLRKYIQFNSFVTKVIPEEGNGDWRTTTWNIEVRNLVTKTISITSCDAVIVCNGHFSKPYKPSIPGLYETFPGLIIHSRSYRKPEDFTNRTVVIFGAGNSGVDITNDVSAHVKTIYLSRRNNLLATDLFVGTDRPINVIIVPAVVSAKGNRLTLDDNTAIYADVFIFCTGYLVDYPFLDKRSGIFVENNRVRPLFLNALNEEHLSMIIVGLPKSSDYGALYYDQVKWFLGLLQDNQTALLEYNYLLENADVLREALGKIMDHTRFISLP